MMLAPVLTPRGLLILRPTEEALALESEQNSRLDKAFLRGPGHGLLCLGANEVGTALPPALSYWREIWISLRNRAMRPSRYRGAGYQAAHTHSSKWRAGQYSGDCSAYDGRRISDGGRFGRSLARHGCSL